MNAFPTSRAFLALAIFLPCLGSAQPTGRVFDVRAFGAKGDGHTLDTGAINAAIAAAAEAGGGTVVFTAGVYPSYSIHLRSHVVIDLGAGATLMAAEPTADRRGGFDAPEPNPYDQYQDFGHSHWHNSLIWGENLEDVAITGVGQIYGYGLQRGSGAGLRDWLPEERRHGAVEVERPLNATDVPHQTPGPWGYPNARDTLPAGIGNKAIALKNCRNVVLRDFTIYHGGHFAILATGVDNLTVDNLKIDTNRDGIDLDCCRNTHVSNCSVNSPRDDGICPKSTYALGYARPCENISITNCHVSGFDEGTMLDGIYGRSDPNPEPGGPTGRIKFGTESSGGYRNIVVSNCVFEYCRGLALEEVDGGTLEDISISNLTMRDLQSASFYIRLGRRNRTPNQPPVGVVRRINISNVVVYNADPRFGGLICGIPGHPIEDVSLSNIRVYYRGGGSPADAKRIVPEDETGYPEPDHFGLVPSYGFFCRHVKNLAMHDIDIRFIADDARPPLRFEDIAGLKLTRVDAAHLPGTPTLVLRNVTDLRLRDCDDLPDGKIAKTIDQTE